MYHQTGFGAITPAVKNLLFANIAVYVLQILTQHAIDYYFILWPSLVLHKFTIWQLVTYMFLHGGLGHIFFNMFALWMFGTPLEREMGTREFLKYYFITGISAGVFITLFTTSPTLGASGAIYGILIAVAMFYPDERAIIFPFFIPIKLKYLALILGALSFISLSSDDGIAHIAHLGGMVVGFIYIRYRYRHYGVGKDFFKNMFGGGRSY